MKLYLLQFINYSRQRESFHYNPELIKIFDSIESAEDFLLLHHNPDILDKDCDWDRTYGEDCVFYTNERSDEYQITSTFVELSNT